MKKVANYKFWENKDSCIQYNNTHTRLKVIQVISNKLDEGVPNFTTPADTHEQNASPLSTISFDKLLRRAEMV